MDDVKVLMWGKETNLKRDSVTTLKLFSLAFLVKGFSQNNPFPINNGGFVCGVVFSRKILLPGVSSVGVGMTSPRDAGVTKATRASSPGAGELELILVLHNPSCGLVFLKLFHF